MTWRKLAAWAWLLFGVALAVAWASVWLINGVPDSWSRRITEPTWVLWGVLIMESGRHWLRALRADPKASLADRDFWGRKRR
jgi:hypothetical protein